MVFWSNSCFTLKHQDVRSASVPGYEAVVGRALEVGIDSFGDLLLPEACWMLLESFWSFFFVFSSFLYLREVVKNQQHLRFAWICGKNCARMIFPTGKPLQLGSSHQSEKCSSIQLYLIWLLISQPSIPCSQVDVEAFNEEGRKVSFSAKGWQARQLQHTADMLEGVLYVDRLLDATVKPGELD